MKHGIFLATLWAGALALTACSPTATVKGAADPAASISSSGRARWTTSIKAVTQGRFSAPDSTRDKSYGSAEWSRGDGPTLSSVNVEFTYTGTERSLSWAILFGNCRSASLPVIPISSFPELEIGGGGRAQVIATLSLELPTSGSYHIEIYRDRQGGNESLVGCGNLKFVGG